MGNKISRDPCASTEEREDEKPFARIDRCHRAWTDFLWSERPSLSSFPLLPEDGPSWHNCSSSLLFPTLLLFCLPFQYRHEWHSILFRKDIENSLALRRVCRLFHIGYFDFSHIRRRFGVISILRMRILDDIAERWSRGLRPFLPTPTTCSRRNRTSSPGERACCQISCIQIRVNDLLQGTIYALAEDENI